MGIYYINEHVLSANVRAVITDDQQRATFVLIGKWGRVGDAVKVYNLSGDVLASAIQIDYATPATFDLYIGDQKVGTLKHVVSLRRGFYAIRNLKWLATANFKRQEYSIHSFHGRVMKMTKRTTYQGDMYQIKVKDEELVPICICIGAVIDYWNRLTQKEISFNQPLIYDKQVPFSVQCIEEEDS